MDYADLSATTSVGTSYRARHNPAVGIIRRGLLKSSEPPNVRPGVLALIERALQQTEIELSRATTVRRYGDWVRLFCSGTDESDFDHLTSVSFGREGGSGLGTAPSA